MKIGIDINPILVKGVGKAAFLKNILISLFDIDQKNSYFLFGYEYPSLDLPDNFKFVHIHGVEGATWDLNTYLMSKLKYRVDVYYSAKSFWGPIFHKKSVFNLHDVGPLKIPQAYPAHVVLKYKRLLKLALWRTAFIITPSYYIKKFLVNNFKVPNKKIIKISGGIPRWTSLDVTSEDYERVISEYSLPEKFFLFAGTLEPRKNLNTLIDAFRLFKEKHKNDIKLLIVGKRGYKADKIFKHVIDKELSHDVVFTGHIPEIDLKPIYTKAIAFVFPSLHEGFGLSPLEAMACGIPVLSDTSNALGESLGKACLEINPESSYDIAEKLFKIQSDSKLKNSLIKKGFERTKLFDWNRSAKKLLSVFTQV